MDEKKISVTEVLNKIFISHKTDVSKNIIFGKGDCNGVAFNILGTIESTFLGVDEALLMAQKVVEIVKAKDQNPILLLVDVIGQKLEKRDEWLGMYAYFAHLLKCLQLARKQGNKLFSLVYNQAIGGSFIAFGMMADRIYALPHAELAVMWLEAMSKVIKIDEAFLKEISKTSAVFAPGVDNFKKLGGLHEVLELEKVSGKMCEALKEPDFTLDNRAYLGDQFKGRTKAYKIIEKTVNLS